MAGVWSDGHFVRLWTHPCVGDFLPILPVFNPSLEFRMGKIFNTNTWRAPLQLIDCWLPLPNRAPARPAASAVAAQALQRFSRAGWLNREAANGAARQTQHVSEAPASAPCRVRVLRQADVKVVKRPAVRLVISGPINDVCAELDRLAALEQASMARAA